VIAVLPESLGIARGKAVARPGLDRQQHVAPVDVDAVEALFLVAQAGRGGGARLNDQGRTGTGGERWSESRCGVDST